VDGRLTSLVLSTFSNKPVPELNVLSEELSNWLSSKPLLPGMGPAAAPGPVTKVPLPAL